MVLERPSLVKAAYRDVAFCAGGGTTGVCAAFLGFSDYRASPDMPEKPEGLGVLSSRMSVFLGQQNTGGRAVGFSNHPNLDPGNTQCVHGHQPESLLKRKLILPPVMGVNVTPIAGLMARKIGRKVVARYPNCC
jgi:hypothetical protein